MYIFIYIVQFSYNKDVSNHKRVILINENSPEVGGFGVNKDFWLPFVFSDFLLLQ